MASSRALNWVLLDHTAPEPVQAGDLISAAAGGMPIYQVMALEDRRVLCRDDRHPLQALPLDRFLWTAATAN